jgi:hypothetical protein
MASLQRFSGLFLAVAIGLGTAGVAHAYVPPSHFLVKTLAAKKAGAKAVRYRTVVQALEGGHPSGPRFRQLTVYDFGTHVLRSTAQDDQGHDLYVIERRLGMAGSAPLADYLIFENQAALVELQLKSVGIPIRTEEDLASLPDEEARVKAERTFLSRWKSDVAWVVGERGKPDAQLWLEKDAFLPLRLAARRDGEEYELRFDGFRFTREVPFPRAVTLLKGVAESARPALREELTEVNLVSSAPELRTAATPGFTEAGNSADSAVRDLIQAYYQYLR